MADLHDDTELTRLVCRWVATVTGGAWHELGVEYTRDGLSVVYGSIDETSDRIIGVQLYLWTDIDTQYLHWRRVQLRIRGSRDDLLDADAIASRIFAARHTLSREGGISGVSRASVALLGADDNGRMERTDNYTIILDNQESS
ncbi:minor capsid protein [Microbacterium sp. NPDC080220]|uniref:minor capsid protein n=1 Tax=Microbacterium sp. NPDC080220 TaxID=3161017 RepID=UPI00343A9C6A